MLCLGTFPLLIVLGLVAGDSVVSASHGMKRKIIHKPHHHHHHHNTHTQLESQTRSTTSSMTPVPSSHSHCTSPISSTSRTSSLPIATTTRTVTSNDPRETHISNSSLTPNGIKAGIAGGDAYPILKDHIGWWYDWSPNPSKPGKPIAVPMLWGGGTADSTDAARLRDFKKISKSPYPAYVLGYEEPDCTPGSGSAGMTVAAGVSEWNALMAPLGAKGTKLGSPSMCKQADETWLKEFSSKISHPWDFTAIHINKNNLNGVKKDIEHYWNTYGKPIWVTEFACVNDVNGFTPCTDQNEINQFINQIVPFLENHPNVHAYAYSNGMGLGNVWPLTKSGSLALSASGQTYLAAIKKFH